MSDPRKTVRNAAFRALDEKNSLPHLRSKGRARFANAEWGMLWLRRRIRFQARNEQWCGQLCSILL